MSQAQKAILLLPHTAKGASTSSEELNAQISPRTDDEHNLPYHEDYWQERRPDGSVGMALVLPALTDCRWWFESLLVHSGVSSATRRKATGADQKKKKTIGKRTRVLEFTANRNDGALRDVLVECLSPLPHSGSSSSQPSFGTVPIQQAPLELSTGNCPRV